MKNQKHPITFRMLKASTTIAIKNQQLIWYRSPQVQEPAFGNLCLLEQRIRQPEDARINFTVAIGLKT